MSEPAGGLTYCSECEHVFRVNKNDRPAYWLCLQHRRADAVGFVDRTELLTPPYAPCRMVNFGFCRLYQPARGGEPSHDSVEMPHG